MKPTVVINLKTYQQGKKAIELAKRLSKIAGKLKINLILGVQAADIYEITKATKLSVYAQHVDYFEPGRNTGFILPEAVKKDKAIGSFLNHSEHPLEFKILKKTVKRCKEVGLKTMVFAPTYRIAKKISKLKPNYIVFEPPSLVAGNVSVSKLRPDAIAKICKKLKKSKILVGAGIKKTEDVKTALELGAKGIAVSSAITKAKYPGKKLKELLK